MDYKNPLNEVIKKKFIINVKEDNRTSLFATENYAISKKKNI